MLYKCLKYVISIPNGRKKNLSVNKISQSLLRNDKNINSQRPVICFYYAKKVKKVIKYGCTKKMKNAIPVSDSGKMENNNIKFWGLTSIFYNF